MNKLETGIVELWLATEAVVPAMASDKAWEDLLSAEEQQRWQRFARPVDRQRFLLARALTRIVLGKRLGMDPASLVFIQNKFGKPQLKLSDKQALRFNLSHTQGLVVLAVSSHAELGVDVERSTRKVEELALARRYFSTPEVRVLEDLEGEALREHFFALWTLKEAWVKAKGLGLHLGLDAFGFELQQGKKGNEQISMHCAPQLQETPEHWSFRRFREGEHRIALAVETGSGNNRQLQVQLKRWTP